MVLHVPLSVSEVVCEMSDVFWTPIGLDVAKVCSPLEMQFCLGMQGDRWDCSCQKQLGLLVHWQKI